MRIITNHREGESVQSFQENLKKESKERKIWANFPSEIKNMYCLKDPLMSLNVAHIAGLLENKQEDLKLSHT